MIHFIENSFGKVVFQIFAEIKMTLTKIGNLAAILKRLFFRVFFSLNMVVFGVGLYIIV